MIIVHQLIKKIINLKKKNTQKSSLNSKLVQTDLILQIFYYDFPITAMPVKTPEYVFNTSTQKIIGLEKITH